ncbi:MAG: SWIM zinc finger family protein [Desulfuromonadaceae bacterium]|nr:SWIM zinc finger family protein [Desulfuromonadaceae bacterium]MDD5104768.1 SWIM zinc finger family protein [Desulfuromonadaceae bacterium]
MEERVFFVQGSAQEPYKVSFQKNNNNLTAYCTCPAGENGQYCKHRLNILGGTTDGLVSENIHDVETVISWLSGTDLEIALNEFKFAEYQFDNAKRKLAEAKKRLSKSIRF